MLQGPDGRQFLIKLRAALAAGVPMKVIGYSEDEEQSEQEGDSMEEGEFESPAYADDVLEEHGSNDYDEEEKKPADDDDDHNGGQLMDKSKDATTSTAAVARLEEVVKDLVNENKDDNGSVEPATEIVVEKKKTPSVGLSLGCAVLISMGWLAILMTAPICEYTWKKNGYVCTTQYK